MKRPKGWPMLVAQRTHDVLGEVAREREAQDGKWGEQSHPDGTGLAHSDIAAAATRVTCERAFRNGTGTWRHILDEEVAEAFAESDPARLREELVQIAAVAVAWVEAIDRRAQ